MKKTNQILIILFVFCLVFPITSVFATEEDSWESMESMPTARCGMRVAVVAGKIYIIGGSNGNNLGTNEMYDPKTDTWTTKKPMPTLRNGGAVAVYQNKIYMIGGTIGIPSVPPNFSGANEAL